MVSFYFESTEVRPLKFYRIMTSVEPYMFMLVWVILTHFKVTGGGGGRI